MYNTKRHLSVISLTYFYGKKKPDTGIKGISKSERYKAYLYIYSSFLPKEKHDIRSHFKRTKDHQLK